MSDTQKKLNSEIVIYVKNRFRNQQKIYPKYRYQGSYSPPHSRKISSDIKYYFYKKKDHVINAYLYKFDACAFIQTIKNVKKDKNRRLVNRRVKKIVRVYFANYFKDKDDNKDIINNDNNNSEIKDISQLTQDTVTRSKTSSHKTLHRFIGDIGTSSHMTDNRNLFNTLKLIYRRTIKVRGGLLYTDYASKVRLSDELDGTLDLRHVLYVPELEASLMSEQKLCKTSLKREFDAKYIYLKDKNDTPIIKYSRKNDIYFFKLIVNGEHAYKVSAYPEAQSNENYITF